MASQHSADLLDTIEGQMRQLRYFHFAQIRLGGAADRNLGHVRLAGVGALFCGYGYRHFSAPVPIHRRYPD